MVKHDDKTIRGWPLPHRENRLYDDVERLREALNLIDEAISGVETHEGVIEDKQDSLETRLDTILEGATEDSEILDARVDAEDEVHPNLGHNIRNLHRLILGLGDDILYEGSEFEGLLRQYSDLAHAQLRGELNSKDAHERRKLEIKQEALSRFQDDSSIQSQVDLLAENDIKNALARKTERETSIAEHEARIEAEEFLQDEIDAEIKQRQRNDNAEILQRIEHDEVLQVQINQLANSILQNTISFRNSIERRKLEIKQEIFTRSKNEEDFHSQLNENLIKCGMLQVQIDSLVSAVFHVNSSLLSLAESFQHQIDSNAQAGLNNALAIHREAEERRKLLTRLIQEKQDRKIQIQALRAEIGQLYEIPLPGLRDDLASLHGEAENNAHANLRNSVTIAREINTRRKDFSLIKQEISAESQLRRENDSALQSQIDSAIQSILRNAFILSKTFSHGREALNQEAFTRNEEDAGILQQTNQLAHAVLRLAVQQHQTSKRVSEIETGEAQAQGRVATDEEFNEMLDRLYNKS